MYQEFLLSFLYKDWRTISKEDAARTSFYGLRGWLLLFYATSAIGVVMNVIDVMSPLHEAYFQTYGNRPNVIRVVLLTYAAAQVPFLILAPLKHRLLPKVWLVSIWAPMVVYVAAIDMPGQTDGMILRLALSFGGAALMSWYVLHSKRVNVTYLLRVPASDDAADYSKPSQITASVGKIPKPTLYRRAEKANRIFWGLAVLAAIAALATLLAR